MLRAKQRADKETNGRTLPTGRGPMSGYPDAASAAFTLSSAQ
jgi:hypothetical protein